MKTRQDLFGARLCTIIDPTAFGPVANRRVYIYQSLCVPSSSSTSSSSVCVSVRPCVCIYKYKMRKIHSIYEYWSQEVSLVCAKESKEEEEEEGWRSDLYQTLCAASSVRRVNKRRSGELDEGSQSIKKQTRRRRIRATSSQPAPAQKPRLKKQYQRLRLIILSYFLFSKKSSLFFVNKQNGRRRQQQTNNRWTVKKRGKLIFISGVFVKWMERKREDSSRYWNVSKQTTTTHG